MDRFELIDEDYEAILAAKNAARLLLKQPNITPEQIITLGKALHALEHLPDVTPKTFIEFGVSYRNGDDGFEEMKYILFRISNNDFEISRGGSTYDSSVGGDTYSRPGWLIEVDGGSERDCDLSGIEGAVVEYINLGAKLIVTDEAA